MNINQTLHDKILAVSKGIASYKGFRAINIRAVASKAEVSIGSVYNYFPDKLTLLQATIAISGVMFFIIQDSVLLYIHFMTACCGL